MRPHPLAHFTGGFTLIELAIVLAVLTLLIGGSLSSLAAFVVQKRVSETTETLADAKEALIGFAILNGRLPCPATLSSNGSEASPCPTSGFLPWVTLGVKNQDGWGHLIRYAVSPSFATSITFSSTATITLKTRDAGGASTNLSTLNDIPAVVLSHGPNGLGAVSADSGTALPQPGSGTDEATNANSSTVFYSRTLSDNPTAAGGPFDDVVDWISPNILFARMVAAQKLP